jgi:hypothetical protein
LVEESGVPGENHWPATSHWQTLLHNVVSSTPCHEWDSNSEHYDCISSYRNIVESDVKHHNLILLWFLNKRNTVFFHTVKLNVYFFISLPDVTVPTSINIIENIIGHPTMKFPFKMSW